MTQSLSPVVESSAVDVADDAARFTALLEQSKRILYKVAYIYCRDPEDRQDLVQEMVIQLWRAFQRFDGRASLSTWTYRVALNVAISYRRQEGRRIRGAEPLEIVLNVAEADHAFDPDAGQSRVLRTLIDDLDELNRSLMLLYLEGFDHAEIAGLLGVSVSNVGTRLSRIRQTLKTQIEKRGKATP